jgi:hypothetical protein
MAAELNPGGKTELLIASIGELTAGFTVRDIPLTAWRRAQRPDGC